MLALFGANGAIIEAFQAGYFLLSRTIITTTGSSTYTTPTNARLLVVECIGGGGGGATTANAAAGQIAIGTGGSGGGYAAGVVATVSGRTFAAVVHAGGAATATGGVTTFTGNTSEGAITYVSAQGGNAGIANASAATELFNESSQTAIGTAIGNPLSGTNTAFIMHRVSGTVACTGPGGLGPLCGAPPGRITQGNGAAGGNYGTGGAGGLSINAGGAGTGGHGGQGVIVVWEFA